MSPRSPFRLPVGGVGPTQQSRVSCGAACLVVARMLVDDAFSAWVRTGHGVPRSAPDVHGGGRAGEEPAPGDGGASGAAGRFAQAERDVMARTNAAAPRPGRAQLPWPRALGTPVWGALAELESAAAPGVTYEVAAVRQLGPEGLRRAQGQLAGRVRPGAPALLYVGSRTLPRHVTLVFAAADDAARAVYEPSSGRVLALSGLDFAGRSLGLAGWDEPWFVVWPGPARRVRSAAGRRRPSFGLRAAVEPPGLGANRGLVPRGRASG